MSKQFSAKKLSFKVIIQKPVVPQLNEYYRLKNIYEDAIQKQKSQKKCVKCREANMNTLQFITRDRKLIGICPTEGCPVNMTIPIETCVMYNDYYMDKKKEYETISNSILSEKFNILFGYKKEQSSNILELKELYIHSFATVQRCIDTYKEIVYPNQERIQEFEQKRDVLVEEIKGMEFIPPNIFDQLKQILCEIRKLKYKKIDIPNVNTSVVKMPYTFPDLEICESEGPILEDESDVKLPTPKLVVQNPKPQKSEPKVKNPDELNTTEKKDEYVQFYSGSKDKTMQLLSNLAPLNVVYQGKDYPSVEHAYQLMKYEFSEPKDKAMAVMEKLLEESKTLSGKEAVVLGKRKRMEKEGVKLNIQEWNKVSPGIMENLLIDKIQRHPEIRKILEQVKESGKKLLHYSLRDLEWGGFFTKDKVTGEEGLKGNNELGKIFMKLV
jgi:ribA/ribD-fused uncharacterized protein